MILTGATSLTVNNVLETIDPELEKTSNRTAGGNLRSITGGERYKIKCKARMTYTQFRSFMNILRDGSDNYFYTPEETTESWSTDLYPSISFPINANIYNVKVSWDNGRVAYVEYNVESTGYL